MPKIWTHCARRKREKRTLHRRRGESSILEQQEEQRKRREIWQSGQLDIPDYGGLAVNMYNVQTASSANGSAAEVSQVHLTISTAGAHDGIFFSMPTLVGKPTHCNSWYTERSLRRPMAFGTLIWTRSRRRCRRSEHPPQTALQYSSR